MIMSSNQNEPRANDDIVGGVCHVRKYVKGYERAVLKDEIIRDERAKLRRQYQMT